MSSGSRPHPLPEASPYSRHIPALDGVRGLAVLAVMGSHLFPGNGRTPLLLLTQQVLAYGATGVDLFFVLSGFLITGILYDSLEDEHFFRKFYARRVLRIFPLYYGVLAFYALGALFLHWRYNGQLWSLALYLQNTGLVAQPIYRYIGASVLPLGHFWSLAIEEQFYLVWPLLVFLLRDRRPLLVTCAVAIVLCPILRAFCWWHHWPYFPVHMGTLFRADALLTGAALALLLRSPAHDRTLAFAPWALLAGVLLMAFFIMMPSTAVLAPYWPSIGLSLRYTAFDLLYVALLAQTLRSGWLTRLCSLGPLRSLGRYSYGLYVLHLILFFYFERWFRGVVTQHVTTDKAAVVVLSGLFFFALSFAAAYASFHLYEKHFLRLKRFFSYRRRETPTVASAV